MRYGTNIAAVTINVPVAILFALTARPGRTMPAAICVLIVLGLAGLAAWKFPRGEHRSNYQWFIFLTLVGSAILWLGIFVLALTGEALSSIAYSILNVLIFGGIGLILFGVFASYVSVRKERGF